MRDITVGTAGHIDHGKTSLIKALTGIDADRLPEEKQRGVSKRFATLVVDAGDCDAPYMSTLWHDGKIVGETTSGGWGYRVNKSIALGMLRADLNVPGTELEVEIYGERFKATVQADEPLWDPKNERIRA